MMLRPSQLQVRLDWSETELYALINGIWVEGAPTGGRPADDLPDDVPPALRAMIEANRSQHKPQPSPHMLPQELMDEIMERAQALGIRVGVQQDGAALEISAPLR